MLTSVSRKSGTGCAAPDDTAPEIRSADMMSLFIPGTLAGPRGCVKVENSFSPPFEIHVHRRADPSRHFFRGKLVGLRVGIAEQHDRETLSFVVVPNTFSV